MPYPRAGPFHVKHRQQGQSRRYAPAGPARNLGGVQSERSEAKETRALGRAKEPAAKEPTEKIVRASRGVVRPQAWIAHVRSNSKASLPKDQKFAERHTIEDRARGFIYASATPPVRLGCSLNPHRQTCYASFYVLVRSTASGAGRTAGRARHERCAAVHSSPTGVGHTAATAGHSDMIPARAARNATFLAMAAHGQERAKFDEIAEAGGNPIQNRREACSRK